MNNQIRVNETWNPLFADIQTMDPGVLVLAVSMMNLDSAHNSARSQLHRDENVYQTLGKVAPLAGKVAGARNGAIQSELQATDDQLSEAIQLESRYVDNVTVSETDNDRFKNQQAWAAERGITLESATKIIEETVQEVIEVFVEVEIEVEVEENSEESSRPGGSEEDPHPLATGNRGEPTPNGVADSVDMVPEVNPEESDTTTTESVPTGGNNTEALKEQVPESNAANAKTTDADNGQPQSKGVKKPAPDTVNGLPGGIADVAKQVEKQVTGIQGSRAPNGLANPTETKFDDVKQQVTNGAADLFGGIQTATNQASTESTGDSNDNRTTPDVKAEPKTDATPADENKQPGSDVTVAGLVGDVEETAKNIVKDVTEPNTGSTVKETGEVKKSVVDAVTTGIDDFEKTAKKYVTKKVLKAVKKTIEKVVTRLVADLDALRNNHETLAAYRSELTAGTADNSAIRQSIANDPAIAAIKRALEDVGHTVSLDTLEDLDSGIRQLDSLTDKLIATVESYVVTARAVQSQLERISVQFTEQRKDIDQINQTQHALELEDQEFVKRIQKFLKVREERTPEILESLQKAVTATDQYLSELRAQQMKRKDDGGFQEDEEGVKEQKRKEAMVRV